MLEFRRRHRNEINGWRPVKEVSSTKGYPASMKIHWQIKFYLPKCMNAVIITRHITDLVRRLSEVKEICTASAEVVSSHSLTWNLNEKFIRNWRPVLEFFWHTHITKEATFSVSRLHKQFKHLQKREKGVSFQMSKFDGFAKGATRIVQRRSEETS